jgi:hypothetical protein
VKNPSSYLSSVRSDRHMHTEQGQPPGTFIGPSDQPYGTVLDVRPEARRPPTQRKPHPVSGDPLDDTVGQTSSNGIRPSFTILGEVFYH